MILKDNIQSLVNQKIEGTEIFLVYLEVASGNKIIVEVDKAPSISIKECVEISRFIEHNLDRELEDFELKVSSPGLDKPLRHPMQFTKNVGRTLKVVEDGETQKGVCTIADETSFTLQWEDKVKVEGKKKKEKKTFTKQYKIANIKEAKVVVSF